MINLTISFHAGDAAAAAKLGRYIASLHGPRREHLIICAALGCPSAEVTAAWSQTFPSHEVFVPHDDINGWPHGPNRMFRRLAAYIAHRGTTADKYRRPWLFLEPDAVPLTPDWLDRLTISHEAVCKPFTGALVEIPGTARHMSGVAIYPWNLVDHSVMAMKANATAWDVYAAEEILPQANFTNLIQHKWFMDGTDKVPTFKGAADMAMVDSNAVIFHRCKDLSILKFLGNPGLDDTPPEPVREIAPKEPLLTWSQQMGRLVDDLARMADKPPHKAQIVKRLKKVGLLKATP